MFLTIPGVGTENGPEYAVDINNCMTTIDAHDHTPGNGAPITSESLSITETVSFNDNLMDLVKGVQFSSQSVALTSVGTLHEVGNDLYFVNGAGLSIQITNSSGVAGTAGSIANLVSPASASYVAVDETFVWMSSATEAAKMDAGHYILRNLTPSSYGLTLKPPTLASDYDITLPQLPASTLPVSISATGAMSAAQITMAQLSAQIQDLLGRTAPTGSVVQYAGATAPTGYLLCDGAAVSRVTYAALYAAIGDAFGEGDGSTTFNVPDTGGRFIRGVNNGQASRDPDAASRTASNTGGNTGNNVGSVQADQAGPHTHGVTDPGHTHNIRTQNDAGTGTAGNGPTGSTASGANGVVGISPIVSNTTGISINSNGTSETRPLNIYFNFIIKT